MLYSSTTLFSLAFSSRSLLSRLLIVSQNVNACFCVDSSFAFSSSCSFRICAVSSLSALIEDTIFHFSMFDSSINSCRLAFIVSMLSITDTSSLFLSSKSFCFSESSSESVTIFASIHAISDLPEDIESRTLFNSSSAVKRAVLLFSIAEAFSNSICDRFPSSESLKAFN